MNTAFELWRQNRAKQQEAAQANTTATRLRDARLEAYKAMAGSQMNN